MRNKWFIIALLGLGLLTRFIFFGYPNETVFDEVHFGKFISGYYTGEYFFDIHPPLGKLGIAGFAKLFNFEPGFAFDQIGNQFPDNQYLLLRFLPSLAGALLPLVIFLLLLEMKMNPIASFIGGLLIVFENALITQSRFILLDSFLLLFGFLAFLFYFRSKNNPSRSRLNMMLFGLFAGLAVSVKWTGLSFLALPLIFEFLAILKKFDIKNTLAILVYPLLIALGIYFTIFASHLIILDKTGPGDAFMSIGFQKTLSGNTYNEDPAVASNLIQKFMELNVEMYKANQRLTATHPYSSQWYAWPLMTRPIYYWVKGNLSNQELTARIYLIGNPVIWWLSTLGILIIVSRLLNNPKDFARDKIALFLLSGYILNILPFIGVKRVMFLYHYFTAYILAVLILAYILSNYYRQDLLTNKYAKTILITILVAITISFLYFAPLSYGLGLSPSAYEARAWFSSWK